MPGIAEGKTWSRTTCQRVAPSASAACRSEMGTVRSASCVAITITGRIKRPSVKAPARDRLTHRQPLEAEGVDEQGQAQQIP